MEEDLFQTITRGLPGSGMPGFEELSDGQRRQLVAYVKSLSPTFTEQMPQPVLLATDPGASHADLVKGQQVYKDLGCAACHGNLGRADGPSAKGLVDDWGSPIRPADLTQGWTYRGGSDARAVALRILTGIDGAGMPSYAEAVSPEDAWHLAYYVASLQEEPRWNITIYAVATSGPLPTSVSDPLWADVEQTHVSLGSTVYRDGAIVPTMVNVVVVQAVYNNQSLALRLTWDDPTEDRGAPADALGLVLRPEGVGLEVGGVRTWPLPDSPALEVVYWSADGGEIHRGIAVGFAPVATSKAPVDILPGEAAYADGRWTLLIHRPLNAAKRPGAVQLTGNRPVPLAIAIWDGGNNEQRKVRSSSAWLELALR
jgi:DMSO reductase family type II enzyme heme b subunit